MTAATSLLTRDDSATRAADKRPRLIPVPDYEPPLDPGWTVREDASWAPAAVPTPPPAAPVEPATGSPHPIHTWRAYPAPRVGTIPAPPRPRRRGRPFRPITVSSARTPGWSEDPDVGVTMTPTAALPSAERAGVTLARALVETLAGCRNLEQLRVHCAPDVFVGLQDVPMLGGRHATQLISTMICEPDDGVAEVSVVFRCAQTVRALAMRMQGIDGSWRVTALQLG